jgi:hypothetical protein
VHFNVTAHPTAEWTAQQMLEAFPFDTAPRYLLRDRDRIYGQEFRNQVTVMNIKEVLSAPRSPWQRAYVERVIGSIRRECLDHVIVLSEESLRRTLRSYFSYHRSRLHLSLERDSPESRSVHRQDRGFSRSRWPAPSLRSRRVISDSAIADLLSKDAIFLYQVRDYMLLMLVNPTGDGHDEKGKWIQSSLHGAENYRSLRRAAVQ